MKEDIFVDADNYVADVKKEAIMVHDVSTKSDPPLVDDWDSIIESVKDPLKDEVKLEIRESDSFIPIDFKSDLYDGDDSQKLGDYYKVDIGKALKIIF